MYNDVCSSLASFGHIGMPWCQDHYSDDDAVNDPRRLAPGVGSCCRCWNLWRDCCKVTCTHVRLHEYVST